MEPDDRELLRRYVANGDERAFEALVDRYTGLVRGVARRRTGDDELSREVAQRVFTILARKAGQLEAQASIAGWLSQAAFYEAAKAVRGEKVRRERLASYRDALAGSPPEGSGVADSGAMEAALDAALAELPSADREILFLRFFEGKGFREIGELLGKSENASQKKTSRAVAKLAGRLQKRGAVVAGSFGVILHKHFLGGASAAAPVGSAAPLVTFSLQPIVQTMTYGKIATAAAVALVAAIPIGLQRSEINDLREQLGSAVPGADRGSVLPSQAEPVQTGAPGVATAPSGLVGSPEAGRADLGKWRAALSEVDPQQRLQLVSSLLSGLDAETAPQVAAIFRQALPMTGVSDPSLMMFLRAWGRSDGEAAIRYAITESDYLAADRRNDFGVALGTAVDNGAREAALSGWASADPEAAMDWLNGYQGARGPGERDRLLYALIDGWTLADLDGAVAHLNAKRFVPSGPGDTGARRSLMSLVSERVWAEGGIEGAQQWLASIPDSNRFDKDLAFQLPLLALARSGSADAARWFERHVDEPYARRGLSGVVAALQKTRSPQEVMEWVESMPATDDQLASGMLVPIQDFAMRDPEGAGRWIAERADQPWVEDIIGAFTMQIVRADPVAATHWAQYISDPVARDRATDTVIDKHLKNGGEIDELLQGGVLQDVISATQARFAEREERVQSIIQRVVPHMDKGDRLYKLVDKGILTTEENNLVGLHGAEALTEALERKPSDGASDLREF